MSSDIRLAKQHHKAFPEYVWYIAGILQLKTDLSLQLVINYLKKLYADFETYRVPPMIIEALEVLLYDGKIGEAKIRFEEYIAENKNSKQLLEAELEKIMAEMKNLPSYHEKVPPQLEYQSSFSCAICSQNLLNSELCILEDCPHMFHKNCISHELQRQMVKELEKIVCPVKECGIEVKFHYLEQYVSGQIVKEYQEKSTEKALKSGIFGKIIHCPNVKCGIQFSIEADTGYCPSCGVSICGTCYKLLDTCSCNPVLMKRQCPDCMTWIDQSPDRFTNCKKCNIFFCFHCLKKPAFCECRDRHK